MSSYLLGIDLGGSSIKAVAVEPGGEILCRRNIDFDTNEAMDWALKIRNLAEELQRGRGHSAARLGLSAPGLPAKDQLSISFMPGRLQGLENLNWTKFMKAERPIPVLNDAHAALLGEVWLGAAAGLRDVMMLTLGTGVGGAAIVDGQLLRGHIGRAGHLGHVCLNPDGPAGITNIPGSLEYEIGNYSLSERSGGRFRSTHELIEAYRLSDGHATQIWLKSVRALACAVASLVNVLDPEAVIIGGGIARAGPALFEPLDRFLDEVEWRPGGHRVKVLPASLGEFAGALGAARYAVSAF